jgi:sortase (surface protein transpeptidase)
MVMIMMMIQLNSLFIFFAELNNRWPITESERIKTTRAIRQTKGQNKQKPMKINDDDDDDDSNSIHFLFIYVLT